MAYDTSRVSAPKDALPFEIVIEGPGFRVSDRYATEEEAYAEARRIRVERAHSDKVAFRTKFGYAGRYAVGSIEIQRWNPIVQRWANHAQPWSRNSPNPGSLTPLPRDWHGDQLPADW
jgi:hypothetical protein